MPLLLGSHTNNNGGLHMAVLRAGQSGMNALQVFTVDPKFYNDKAHMKPERAQRFRDALVTAGLDAGNVIVHAGYVLNVASHDQEKWARAAAGLAMELERSTALGVRGVCFHPGSFVGGTVEQSIDHVVRAMTLALERVDGKTRLFIENTAGAGRTVGRTAREVAAMLEQLPAALRARAGYGLDTCHLFASGYDIHTSRERFTAILDEFERETGEKPSFFHLNDSEWPFASNRDRHALIGEGQIGSEPFGWLLKDPRARDVPLILETPQASDDIGENDVSPNPYDLRMLELLRSLS